MTYADMETDFEKLKKSKVFKDWKEKDDAYLVHAFNMMEEDKSAGWQFGFYRKSSDKVTTFFVDEEIKKSPESEVFKKDKSPVKKLDLTKVKIKVNQALESALKLQEEKYKGHDPAKQVALLQHIKIGQIWNITFVTRTFDTLNVKVDANTGEIKEEKLTSLFAFGGKAM